jgi:hypothetical protein
MAIVLPEPTALNLAIDSRIEVLRGRRARPPRGRLPRRN